MEIKDLKIDPLKTIWPHVKTAVLRFNLSSLHYSLESSVENSSAFYFHNFNSFKDLHYSALMTAISLCSLSKDSFPFFLSMFLTGAVFYSSSLFSFNR